MTSRRQISLFTEDESTSSAEGSHANRTARPGSDAERKMTATYGPKCLEQFERFSHVGLWAKTFSALLIGQAGWSSTKCRLTWKLKASKSNRLYFQLVQSTPHTSDKEFGSAPTEMLPTPTTDSATNRKDKYKQGGTPLSVAVNKMLPTPTAFDYKSARTPETYEKAKARHAEKGVNLQMPLKQMARNGMLPTQLGQQDGKTSQLNPPFVAEMMGFPTDWTISPFQSGETNPSKPTETQ